MKRDIKCPAKDCGVFYNSKMFVYGVEGDFTRCTCPVCGHNWTIPKQQEPQQ